MIAILTVSALDRNSYSPKNRRAVLWKEPDISYPAFLKAWIIFSIRSTNMDSSTTTVSIPSILDWNSRVYIVILLVELAGLGLAGLAGFCPTIGIRHLDRIRWLLGNIVVWTRAHLGRFKRRSRNFLVHIYRGSL